MSNDKPKYEDKLKTVLQRLNDINYTIDKDNILIINKPCINNKHIDISKEKILFSLIYKYIKYNLYLKYEMKKTYIIPNKKDHFFCSKLIEKTSPHLINKIIIVINDPNNKSGIFSKSNLLFDNINNGCIFPLIEISEKNNYPLILLNPKNKIDEYFSNFWKIYINNQLKYLRNIIFIVQGMSSIPLMRLMKNNKKDFEEKVTKIIMINSKHKKYYQILDEDLKKVFMNKCTNYILSNEPFGELIYSSNNSIE